MKRNKIEARLLPNVLDIKLLKALFVNQAGDITLCMRQ